MSALNMPADWFFLVLFTFDTFIAVCRQRRSNNKAKLRQKNRTISAVKFDMYRNLQRHASRGPHGDSTAFLYFLDSVYTNTFIRSSRCCDHSE